jgi:transposase InsO family protein
MKRAQLKARSHKPFRLFSRAPGGGRSVENLLQQDFQPPALNCCWAGDSIYIRTLSGWQHLAIWIDLFSRRVVGWKLDGRMDAAM